jgi:hypothetical protein
LHCTIPTCVWTPHGDLAHITHHMPHTTRCTHRTPASHTRITHAQEDVASRGRKMVTIVDPHVKRDPGYYIFSQVGLRLGV